MRHTFPYLWILGAVEAVAIGASWPSRYFWQMASCPAGSGQMCTSAVYCDGGAAPGACTAAEPSGSKVGMSWANVRAAQLTVCAGTYTAADGGVTQCTLTGTGTLPGRSYRYSSAPLADGGQPWNNLTGQTATVTSDCTGAVCCTWPDIAAGVESDRVFFKAQDIGVSCGTTLDVMIDGQAAIFGTGGAR